MNDLARPTSAGDLRRQTDEPAADQPAKPTWYARSPHDTPSLKSSPGSALERALAVVETLLEAEHPIGLQEIAVRLDLPRQTAHRIINQLIDAGLVQRQIDKDRIAPGPRMRRIALDTVRYSHRSGAMHAVLEELAERTGETCNLGVLDGDKVLLLDRVESHWALRVHSEVGRRLDFHSSSIGKTLVAHLPKARRHRLITARPLKRFTSFTITDEAALEAEFAAIRRRGYSVSNQGTMLGMFSIAAPVRDPGGRVIAGMACQVPLMRIPLDEAEKTLLQPLMEAVNRVEALIALDYDGDR
jgi:IclR family acetate operon transcriptional repressor